VVRSRAYSPAILTGPDDQEAIAVFSKLSRNPMAEPARKTMTVADFLRWEDGTETRAI